jgi:hypothetical protein
MKTLIHKAKIVTTIILLSIVASNLKAQTASYGLYKSSKDYNNKTMSPVLNKMNINNRISLNHFFSGKSVKVVQNGNTSYFLKDSLFGYRDGNQQDYRFYTKENKEYQILENKSIVIYYVADVLVTTYNGRTLNVKHSPAYFFSKSLNGKIQPLTIQNLKQAFPGNLEFASMLDLYFGDDIPVSFYNNESKMYEVNYILEQSIVKRTNHEKPILSSRN